MICSQCEVTLPIVPIYDEKGSLDAWERVETRLADKSLMDRMRAVVALGREHANYTLSEEMRTVSNMDLLKYLCISWNCLNSLCSSHHFLFNTFQLILDDFAATRSGSRGSDIEKLSHQDLALLLSYAR